MQHLLSSLCTSLPYADIRFEVTFTGSGCIPPFRGATLRGALGYTLKKTVCHVKGGQCRECPVMTSCVYSTLFEGVAPPNRTIMEKYQTIPQPFVLILPHEEDSQVEPGQTWQFGMRLFGPAIRQMPYLAYCMMQIGEQGLGRDKISYQVNQIDQIYSDGREAPLYEPPNSTIAQAEADTIRLDDTPSMESDQLQVHYLTPVKYRYRGRLYSKPDFAPFMMAAVRRLRIMSAFYGRSLDDQIDFHSILATADQVQLVEDQTQMDRFDRYSNRQKAKMVMGGIVGQATYAGDFNRIAPVLKLAELTHVGKNTSFGFGRIETNPIS